MLFYNRPYQAASDDLNKMTALVQASWQPRRRPDTNFHNGDLYWRLRELAYEQELWLWEDAQGQLAGFAEWAAAEATLEVQIHPEYADSDLSRQMLEWAEAQALVISADVGTAGAAGTSKASLTAYACEADAAYTILLRKKNYRQQEKCINAHCRRLNNPIETLSLPAGYTVRHLEGVEEKAARVQGHRAGWQSTRMTEAVYARMMQMPGYRFDLDIVVVAPEGGFVATCNVWLDEQNGVGLFEPVSTHADYRRKGLGRAMILYGLKQLRSLGAVEAWVGSVSGNPAATRLYESCKMEIVRQDYHYRQQAI